MQPFLKILIMPMKEMLPIIGMIPTSFVATEIFDSDEDEDIFAEIDEPQSIRMSIYPPHPLEFIKDDYKPLPGDEAPKSLGELYAMVDPLPEDSLMVILEYDRSTSKFDVDPMEIISMIDYREDDEALGLYSVYFENGKMIDVEQLLSATAIDSDGNRSLSKYLHNKIIVVPQHTPLYLYSKSRGKSKVSDIITFNNQEKSVESRSKTFVGIVIYK